MEGLEALSTVSEHDFRINSIEHMVTIIYERLVHGGRMMGMVDATTQTSEDGPSPGPPTPPAPVPILSPPTDTLPYCTPIGVIEVNKEVAKAARRAVALRREVCAAFKHVINARGRKMVCSNRADTQIVLTRTLVYLNRPSNFVNARWPHPRPKFTTAHEVMEFIKVYRNYIMDFFEFTITSEVPTRPAPLPRTAQETSMPYSHKNVIKPWEPQFVF